jgi:hypothetical protein
VQPQTVEQQGRGHTAPLRYGRDSGGYTASLVVA